MTFSLVIPAYNEELYIADCLDCVLRNGGSLIDEIIIVNNASTDRTASLVSRYIERNPHIKLIDEQEKGLTKARHAWYREASGDIIAYIDADTRMPPNWAHAILAAFTTSPQVGFVSWPYLYYDAAWYVRIGNWLYRRVIAYPAYLLLGYMWVGGNFAIKKEVLDQIGWFDTHIAFYGEDTDIARRASHCSKVKFLLHIAMPTSARRFARQGVLSTTIIYMINFLSQSIFHKSANISYKDFR